MQNKIGCAAAMYHINAFEEDEAKLIAWFKHLQQKYAAAYRCHTMNNGFRDMPLADVEYILRRSSVLIATEPRRVVYDGAERVILFISPVNSDGESITWRANNISFYVEFTAPNIEHVIMVALKYYDNRYRAHKLSRRILLLAASCVIFIICFYQQMAEYLARLINQHQYEIICGALLAVYVCMLCSAIAEYVRLYIACPNAPIS
jgi:hypothetical protein